MKIAKPQGIMRREECGLRGITEINCYFLEIKVVGPRVMATLPAAGRVAGFIV